MKTWVRVLFIVILIALVLVGGFVAVTALQAKKVVNIVTNPKITEDITALAQGDCSKLVDVELEVEDIQKTLKSACLNPALKEIMIQQAQGYDPCDPAVQQQALDMLEERRDFCK